MGNADIGYPYDGAKKHYVLDIDDRELARQVIIELLPVISVLKPKKR